MFNAFLYDKQSTQSRHLEDLKNRYIKHDIYHQKAQDKMSGNYKKRIENFVLQMADKPIINHDHIAQVVTIRNEEPSKFIGPSSIKIRSFKNEKDRIKENVENYKNSRMDYSSALHEFRRRDPTREIQPMMRFTSKTNFEKVATRLKEIMDNPNEYGKSIGKGANLSDSFILELSKSPEATNKYLAKHMHPELNTRTHFKATQSLYLGLPDSLTDKAARAKMQSERMNRRQSEEVSSKLKVKGIGELDVPENRAKTSRSDKLPYIRQVTIALKTDEHDDKLSKDLDRQNIETVNPADVSKTVLTRCNVIRIKNQSVKTLPKGEGHLMSMSERNLKQIYQTLYHKQIKSAGLSAL